MYNNSAIHLLFRVWQSYCAQKLAKKPIIRHQPGTKQKRLRVSVRNMLMVLVAELKTHYESSALAPVRRMLRLGR
jgi:hypothetical protein